MEAGELAGGWFGHKTYFLLLKMDELLDDVETAYDGASQSIVRQLDLGHGFCHFSYVFVDAKLLQRLDYLKSPQFYLSTIWTYLTGELI